MSMPSEHLTIIEARVVHKKSNALKIKFHDGPGDPIAEGVQGAGDGKGRKLGTLFGFKNGGTGNHQLTFGDGRVLGVHSRDSAPSLFTQAGGSPLATVTRGDESTATLPDQTPVLTFSPDPDEPTTMELFKVRLGTGTGESLGKLQVIRRAEGWGTALDMFLAADNAYIWWDQAGQPLPVPILGVRMALHRPVDGIERDVLLCACVDMTIGLRPYTSDMR